MSNLFTKGRALFGTLMTNGAATVGGALNVAGNLTATGIVASNQASALSAGTPGFTTASVALARVRLRVTTPATTGVIDTGFDLPSNAVVRSVDLQVLTAEATASAKLLNVGLLASEGGGDTDGFLAIASTASVGVVLGTISGASPTLGALLGVATGSTANVVPRVGHSIEEGRAKSVVYQAAEAQTEFVGDIVITFEQY